jgi:hypothetical protein
MVVWCTYIPKFTLSVPLGFVSQNCSIIEWVVAKSMLGFGCWFCKLIKIIFDVGTPIMGMK